VTVEKLEKKFDSNAFAKRIEEYVKFRKLGYLDAIVLFCEENKMEVESVAPLVKRAHAIKEKLEAECRSNRLVGRGQTADLSRFLAG
jgi:hypothetical protein